MMHGNVNVKSLLAVTNHKNMHVINHTHTHTHTHTQNTVFFNQFFSRLHVSALTANHHEAFYKHCYRKKLYTASRCRSALSHYKHRWFFIFLTHL